MLNLGSFQVVVSQADSRQAADQEKKLLEISKTIYHDHATESRWGQVEAERQSLDQRNRSVHQHTQVVDYHARAAKDPSAARKAVQPLRSVGIARSTRSRTHAQMERTIKGESSQVKSTGRYS